MQVVDVAPNETYTLSALLKGGIAKKAGTLTGKMIIEEAQNKEKRVVTEIASDNCYSRLHGGIGTGFINSEVFYI